MLLVKRNEKRVIAQLDLLGLCSLCSHISKKSFLVTYKGFIVLIRLEILSIQE